MMFRYDRSAKEIFEKATNIILDKTKINEFNRENIAKGLSEMLNLI
jgi:hypothetical protein